ncbi:MAG: PAS domain S-box protein [Candidatus Peribacteraceae bacterium]|nr:PAS domain S-box protein [Candidatus Peribacteraceae bacterium]
MSKPRRTTASDTLAIKLKVLAREKEEVRRKLVISAKEKENVRRKLMVTAKKLRLKASQLAVTAKEKEHVRRKLVVTAKEKESIRRTLVVTAKEKENVRRKLMVTAKKLHDKAAQLAVTAKEKEVVRRTLVETAKKLKISHETLEKKVLERTKYCEELMAKDEAILASIGDGLIATDKSGRILLVNKAFERLLGWKETEARGRFLSKILPMFDANGTIISEAQSLVTKVLKERSMTTSTGTIFYKRKDGTLFPVAITVAPIFIGKELMGAVKVFRDITKEKEIDKARSEFMAIASHQLRTPLTAIRWALSSLKRENLPEELKSMLHTAHETSTQMAVTIRRMLMISYLEESATEPEMTQVDLKAVLEKVVRLHDAHRQRNGLEIEVLCSENLLPETDEQLLIEILDNLLSNAYKYTPRGGNVKLRATLQGEMIRIDVADTGYGIPKEEQRKIPKKFFRASNIASPAASGTGIGLYMVYNIVRLIGGTISFVSVENKGTTFTLLFPS